MDINFIYSKYHKMLTNVAYRMTGSLFDSEDLVHELFLSLMGGNLDHVVDVKAYLVRGLTNRYINLQKSAHRARETYIGEWLPEPIIDSKSDPSHIAERDDTISYAFMVLLDRLSPQERAVFILRETMGYEYHEIAQILGKSESNCRKILSRAKSKLKHPEIAPVQQESELAENFIRGVQTGNFDAFLKLVSEDAVMKTDGGGRVRAALRPVFGRAKIGRFLKGLHARGYFHGDLQLRNVNFHCGIAKYDKDRVEFVICFDLVKSFTPVQSIFLIANPDKLGN